MGVLTDIIVATEDDARIGGGPVKVDSPDRLDLKGVDLVAIATLHSIVGHREPDGSELDEFEQVYEGESGEEWIWRFPAAFSARLAELDPARMQLCADAWAATEEMEGLSIENVKEVIGWLIELARRAQSQRKQMYCWMSL